MKKQVNNKVNSKEIKKAFYNAFEKIILTITSTVQVEEIDYQNTLNAHLSAIPEVDQCISGDISATKKSVEFKLKNSNTIYTLTYDIERDKEGNPQITFYPYVKCERVTYNINVPFKLKLFELTNKHAFRQLIKKPEIDFIID